MRVKVKRIKGITDKVIFQFEILKPMNNMKSNSAAMHAIPVITSQKFGAFWKRVIVKIICPARGIIVNGCNTFLGFVNRFENNSISASNKNERL